VAEVRAAGAYGVAVIRAVWQAPEPLSAIDELLKALG
jgi:thiamine monophosphate synthase